MLGFVQNWLAPKSNPIGVDFGSDSLRLAQVQWTGSEYKLIAAASADVPNHVRHDQSARFQFFIETTRDLLSQGKFRQRQAILGLPAASMFIQHLRMAKLDEAETKKALPWEARGKLPIDPSQALMRHLIAGEVYQDQEPKHEVIVMAAARDLVNQFLLAAGKAKLDIVGMNVEPKALIDCFSQIYRRKTDAESTTCYVDIGTGSTRALIARGTNIFFARSIPIGGEHFTRAAAAALRVNIDEAKIIRMQLCNIAPADEQREKTNLSPGNRRIEDAMTKEAATEATDNSFALLGAGMKQAESNTVAGPASSSATAVAEAPDMTLADEAAMPNASQFSQVERACQEPIRKLVEELDLCRRYYEATFHGKPVDRLVFIGGEARQRSLCQQIARDLGVAAQIGDPLVRMGRISEIGIESGIDRRQPQPGWAVAIGLSMGPGTPAATKESK